MPERIMVFVPMYNCERQIGRVLKQFDIPTRQWFEEIVVVDNRSADRSVAAATAELRALHGLRRTLLQNEENYGLGGSHKVAFNYALDHGFDYCVVLHGDDQGNIQELLPLLRAGLHRRHDCLLGARFMLGSRLEGYSAFRTFGNYVYNGLFSLVCRRMLYDLGSGLNLYRTSYLADRHYRRFGNDLTFNYYAILAAVARKADFRFFPVTWREDDQVSNVKLFRQAWKTLGILGRFALGRQGFLAADHSGRPGLDYRARVLYQADGAQSRAA